MHDENFYYFSEEGILQTGWIETYWNEWFYADSNGIIQMDWQYLNNKWYYLGNPNDDYFDAHMRVGRVEVDGNLYYFTEDGWMETGWKKYDDYGWVYLASNGSSQVGWKFVDNQWYYFENKKIYPDYEYDEEYYVTVPLMVTGWKIIDGNWYYFDASGSMKTSWQEIDGNWYYFNASGSMRTGWQEIDGNWYYFNASGSMQNNWLLLGNTWYYFNESGAMVTGKHKIDNTWYNFNSSGAMQ